MIQVIVNKEETSSNINTESEERHTAKRCCKCLSTSFSSSMKCLTIVFLICFMMLFHSASSQEVKHQCDPTDITTCKYGGVCKSTSTLPQLVNNRYEPSKYICVCEPVACIPILGYDPVCAEDGNTYPNDLCRRHQECLIQKPVKRSCRGTCESLECERDARSNEIACSEDFSYYCFNYGECLVHAETPEQPYCKCLPGYLGSRCESKDAREVKDFNDFGDRNGEINYQVAFLCCLGVLVLVLILQTVYCIIRCYDSSSEDKPECSDNPICKGGQKTSFNVVAEQDRDTKKSQTWQKENAKISTTDVENL